MHPSLVITLILFGFFGSTEQVSVGNLTLSSPFQETSSPISNITSFNATFTNANIALPPADSNSLIQVINATDNVTSLMQVITLTALLFDIPHSASAQSAAMPIVAVTSTSSFVTPRSFYVKRRRQYGVHESSHKTQSANKTASLFGSPSQMPTATRFPRRRREGKHYHIQKSTRPATTCNFAALNISDTFGQQVYGPAVDGCNVMQTSPSSESSSPFWWSVHAGSAPSGILTHTTKTKARPFTLQTTNFDTSPDMSIGSASDLANFTSLDTSTSSDNAAPTSLASAPTGGSIRAATNSPSGGGDCGPQSTSGTWSGQGTFYSPSGQGACQTAIDGSENLVAMNAPQYGSTNQVSDWCGKTVQVTNKANGKSISATVRDACPECACGSLDLSATAFKQIADPVTGIIQISWTA